MDYGQEKSIGTGVLTDGEDKETGGGAWKYF